MKDNQAIGESIEFVEVEQESLDETLDLYGNLDWDDSDLLYSLNIQNQDDFSLVNWEKPREWYEVSNLFYDDKLNPNFNFSCSILDENYKSQVESLTYSRIENDSLFNDTFWLEQTAEISKSEHINLSNNEATTNASPATSFLKICAYISPLSLSITAITIATLAGCSPASLGVLGVVISLCQMIPVGGQIALAATFGVLTLCALVHFVKASRNISDLWQKPVNDKSINLEFVSTTDTHLNHKV